MLDEYGDVTLAIDIMYINEMPFMLTTSQAIHFSTAEMMKNETKSTLIKLIQQIINTFHSRGFRVKQILKHNNSMISECPGHSNYILQAMQKVIIF